MAFGYITLRGNGKAISPFSDEFNESLKDMPRLLGHGQTGDIFALNTFDFEFDTGKHAPVIFNTATSGVYNLYGDYAPFILGSNRSITISSIQGETEVEPDVAYILTERQRQGSTNPEAIASALLAKLNSPKHVDLPQKAPYNVLINERVIKYLRAQDYSLHTHFLGYRSKFIFYTSGDAPLTQFWALFKQGVYFLVWADGSSLADIEAGLELERVNKFGMSSTVIHTQYLLEKMKMWLGQRTDIDSVLQEITSYILSHSVMSIDEWKAMVTEKEAEEKKLEDAASE